MNTTLHDDIISEDIRADIGADSDPSRLDPPPPPEFPRTPAS